MRGDGRGDSLLCAGSQSTDMLPETQSKGAYLPYLLLLLLHSRLLGSKQVDPLRVTHLTSVTAAGRWKQEAGQQREARTLIFEECGSGATTDLVVKGQFFAALPEGIVECVQCHYLESLEEAIQLVEDHFMAYLQPLTDLLRGQARWIKWTFEAEKSFEDLKTTFSTTLVLQQLHPEKPFVVEVDTSDVGVVLSQRRGKSGQLKPIAYFSKKLSLSKRNYGVGDRELLAMKLAFKEWRHCLEGVRHPFTVITNHKNLEYLQTIKRLNSRQARWLLFFSRGKALQWPDKPPAQGSGDCDSGGFLPVVLPRQPAVAATLPNSPPVPVSGMKDSARPVPASSESDTTRPGSVPGTSDAARPVSASGKRNAAHPGSVPGIVDAACTLTRSVPVAVPPDLLPPMAAVLHLDPLDLLLLFVAAAPLDPPVPVVGEMLQVLVPHARPRINHRFTPGIPLRPINRRYSDADTANKSGKTHQWLCKAISSYKRKADGRHGEALQYRLGNMETPQIPYNRKMKMQNPARCSPPPIGG
ncbi:hypothetical protein P4O66_002616 [Electrophorus voltai]|uniref:Reverse transcriptase RNase H-like domain-containing protein n=1 Tax=Electrophorus voltai TaxID=2609070 RepID=A0AAD9DP23_9TELE|nr:hypothetical protein P4O66_002616 [Electrophorus voltai]